MTAPLTVALVADDVRDQVLSRYRSLEFAFAGLPDVPMDVSEEVTEGLLSNDKWIAAQMAQYVVAALWVWGCEIPRSWWATPTGRACSLTVHGDVIPVARAAEVLGVTRPTVYRWVRSGPLVGVDGGVTAASVRVVLDDMTAKESV
jgi:Helix-turn-helix domain